ncbi:27939_t:CDS:2, partial [Racocetra persica]
YNFRSSSLTNSHATNSITNHKTYNVGIRAPNKAKVKPDRKGKHIMSQVPYNEPENSLLPNQRNRPENIYNLEQKVDALGAQLTLIEQTLNNLKKHLDEWCKACELEYFQSNFDKWTSGNKVIDAFIQETQLLATTKFHFLEWIPYSSLTNIKYIDKGGFGDVYSANWVDGPRKKWCADKNDWGRYSNVDVALKSLSKLKDEDFTTDLFEEVRIIVSFSQEIWSMLKSHLTSNNQVSGRFTTLRTYGMTRDPKSKAYMMVMTLADYGDLSAYLKKEFSTLSYIHKLEILYDIVTGICQIHKSGLVHRDLHSRNVMCQGIKNRSLGRGEINRFVIGDFGRAIPLKKDDNNDVC